MDLIESVEYNGFETFDSNPHNDHGLEDIVEYDGFEIFDDEEYHEWKEVINRKRNRKQMPAVQVADGGVSDKIVPNGNIPNRKNTFFLLDEQAEDRKVAAKMVATDVEAGKTEKPKLRKKKKNKKEKKKEVTLPEAVAKIDPSHLADFLVKQALLVGALSEVSSVQFPWLEMFKNIDCCKLWDDLYDENLEGSVALLKNILDEWKDLSLKLSSSSSDALKRTIKSFRLKNEKGITEGGANASLYIDADKYCKVIARRLSRGSGCLIGTAITAVLLSAVGAAAAIMKVSFI